MLTLSTRFVRLRQQGRGNSLVLQTYALLFRSPPLHKLDLSLQLRFLRLYVAQREALMR